jgi:hypothetical protein
MAASWRWRRPSVFPFSNPFVRRRNAVFEAIVERGASAFSTELRQAFAGADGCGESGGGGEGPVIQRANEGLKLNPSSEWEFRAATVIGAATVSASIRGYFILLPTLRIGVISGL